MLFLIRLRPHFIAVCEPELREETCYDENGHPRFVTIPTDISSLRTFCQGHVGRDGHRAEEGKAIRDARKSFYSGHAQMCFYTATFLIVYLHVRSGWPLALEMIVCNYFSLARVL